MDVSALDAIDVRTHVAKRLINPSKPALHKHNAARLPACELADVGIR